MCHAWIYSIACAETINGVAAILLCAQPVMAALNRYFAGRAMPTEMTLFRYVEHVLAGM